MEDKTHKILNSEEDNQILNLRGSKIMMSESLEVRGEKRQMVLISCRKKNGMFQDIIFPLESVKLSEEY